MKATLTITGYQRDVLHDLMLYRFFPIGDRRLRQARLKGVSHERIAEEFGEDLRLMQDLDWGPSQRKRVVLTMKSTSLARTLRRMREDAIAGPAEGIHSEPNETDEEREVRFKLAEQTCDELLAALTKSRRTRK